MKKITTIRYIFLTLLFVMLINPLTSAINQTTPEIQEKNNIDTKLLPNHIPQTQSLEDLDPLTDIHVTVTIDEIRALDEIDKHTDPDFFVKVFINEEKFTSPIWKNENHLENINWACDLDVPDTEEFVYITIELWDWNLGFNTRCDIASNDNQDTRRKELNLQYSLKSGHWIGDDMIYTPHSWYTDLSGYGRGNGCDDNSIYSDDNDCEIFFDITQTDYDHDGMPYWTETNIFQTDPTVDDRGRDDDKDGVPIEWEYKWGHEFGWQYNDEIDDYEIGHFWMYSPFEYNDHENLDPDGDSINNLEEYLTSQWGSDPFRKDIFVELDQMEEGPNGEPASVLSDTSKELMEKSFSRQNILLHLDDGTWSNTGSDMIPFDVETEASWDTPNNELDRIYQRYFLNNAPDDWRTGVFHYGVVIYQSSVVNGNAFGSNRFQISAKGLAKKARMPFPLTGDKDVVFASAYMHELGHSLGLMWLLGHDGGGYYIWQPLWWKSRPYRSIMNYGYMYGTICNLVDYSDGSRGKNDFDDWSNIDYSYFEESFN